MGERKLDTPITFVDGDPDCAHCGAVFQKPYQRMPEAEGTSGNVVLRCPACGCMTPFEAVI